MRCARDAACFGKCKKKQSQTRTRFRCGQGISVYLLLEVALVVSPLPDIAGGCPSVHDGERGIGPGSVSLTPSWCSVGNLLAQNILGMRNQNDQSQSAEIKQT